MRVNDLMGNSKYYIFFFICCFTRGIFYSGMYKDIILQTRISDWNLTNFSKYGGLAAEQKKELRREKPNDEEQRQLQDVTLDMGRRAAAALHQRPA